MPITAVYVVTPDSPTLKLASRMYVDGDKLAWESGGAPPGLLSITDDFERPNAANLGPNYNHPTANYLKIVDGRADPINTSFCVSRRNDVLFTSDNHRVTQRVSATNTLCLPSVRCNSSHQMSAWLLSGSTGVIARATSYSYTGTANAVSIPGWTVAAGDDVSLEAVGEYYIVRKNGVATGIGRDVGLTFHPYVNSDHRECVIGAYAAGAGRGIEQVWWEDLPAAYFYPSRMVKTAATQNWATSATWTLISGWAAANTAVSRQPEYTSIVDSNTLRILTSKAGATLTASVPFSGSAAGRAHTVRIVRVSGSVVAVTGSPVVGESGTCTATAILNVVAGEQYRVEMNSDGASAGTVAASTPTLTVT